MNGFVDHDSDDSSLYIEVDPTGRYGRYNEILGKGSSKIVYRAFDEYEGIEVAWNQVKLTDFLQKPEDLERLYSEIHLLKTLKHKNIMKFYSSWVDINHRNINFVTEMFTSGTLRQYRLKHKKVNIRAVKQWCRQILEGLLYLHSHDPPVIHRDLKCDNIFINGNQGEVKIGDLGLAAILRKSHAARCVGTPEFMAPEVYAEEYNELVDIYSFGMCVLEMVTFEYPYSECTHPAQIYKKVVSGKKPEALFKVKDPEVRTFVEKCLASVANRSSAKELLEDPFLGTFLRTDDSGLHPRAIAHDTAADDISSLVRLPYQNGSSLMNLCDYDGYEPDHEYEHQTLDLAASEIELFSPHDEESSVNSDISIQGRRKENGDIFLRLRITDKEGRIRNIYFPFDVGTDSALSVATEMVSELEINDQDVTRIADMIDGEIMLLVPDWKKGLSEDEAHECTAMKTDPDCSNSSDNNHQSNHNNDKSHSSNKDNHRSNNTTNNSSNNNSNSSSTSSGSSVKALVTKEVGNLNSDCMPKVTLADFIAFGSPAARRIQLLRCSSHGSTSMRGRFEEITTERRGTISGAMEYADAGIQHERRPSWIFHESTSIDVDDADEQHDKSSSEVDGRRIRKAYDKDPRTPYNSPASSVVDDNEYQSEAKKDMSLLKAKYQMQLRELRDQHLTSRDKPPLISARKGYNELKRDKKIPLRSKERGLDDNDLKNAFRKHFSPHFPWDFSQRKRSSLQTRKLQSESCSPENTVTGESICKGPFFPNSLQRTTSLPVDAVDCYND